MSEIYAMQGADGDWFALHRSDGFRVPIFSSSSEADRTRAFNIELLVFKPVILNERAIKDVARTYPDRLAGFWLCEVGSRTMKRGVAFTLDELVALVRNDSLGEICKGVEQT